MSTNKSGLPGGQRRLEECVFLPGFGCLLSKVWKERKRVQRLPWLSERKVNEELHWLNLAGLFCLWGCPRLNELSLYLSFTSLFSSVPQGHLLLVCFVFCFSHTNFSSRQLLCIITYLESLVITNVCANPLPSTVDGVSGSRWIQIFCSWLFARPLHQTGLVQSQPAGNDVAEIFRSWMLVLI